MVSKYVFILLKWICVKRNIFFTASQYQSLLVKCKISGISLVETTCIFLMFLIWCGANINGMLKLEKLGGNAKQLSLKKLKTYTCH